MEHARDGVIESREYRYVCVMVCVHGGVFVCVNERERDMKEKRVGSRGNCQRKALSLLFFFFFS
jgi:hypothetical protein